MKIFNRYLPAILLALAAYGCGSDDGSTDLCGNHRIDPGEQCDRDRLNGQTCEGLGFDSGDLACTDDCRLDTSACENITEPFCGDGVLDAGEECDGGDFGENRCAARGFSGGDLACDRDCRLVWSGCLCADDDREPNEGMSSAVELAPGEYALELCNPGGAEDWFLVSLEAGARLAVQLVQEESDLDLDLILLDENWTLLDQSMTAGLSESAAVTAPEALGVYIQVIPLLDFAGSAGYSLKLAMNPECLEQADCPAGEVCRDFACAEWSCSPDDPCPDDLLCHQGRCVECIGDQDCPDHPLVGCQGNRCVLTCADDPYEPNDTSDQAAPAANDLQEPGLTLCGSSDRDWFSLELDALHRYEFHLMFAAVHGEVDAFLYAAGDPATPLSTGTATGDGAELTHTVAADGAGTYLLQVRLRPGSEGQVYGLAAADLGAVECAADADCRSGEICADYTCRVPDCLDDSECIGEERCTGYSCVPAPPGDDCAEPITIDSLPFSAQGVDIDPYRGNLAFEAGSCTGWGTAGKDVFYRVELAAGQTLLAEVTSSFDAALVLLDSCAAESCLAGADAVYENRTERLACTAPAAGSYLLVVDSALGGDRLSGQFDLEVTSP